MSELINKSDNRTTMRWKLLTGASALALISWANQAVAGDDAPQVWIDLGGQLERIDQSQQIFAPSFTHSLIAAGVIPADISQKPPQYSSGFEGGLEFDPQDSKWQFSASIRYGKSNGSGVSHVQTSSPPSAYVLESVPIFGFHAIGQKPASSRKLGDTFGRTDERHLILDFQAGRDVGLGLFGGKSTVDVGVRFAQFTDKSRAQITANSGPHWQYKYLSTFYGFSANIQLPTESWDVYHAKMAVTRDFRGVGPSLAFKTSVPVAGNVQSGQLGFDLGVNGSLLFGRQRTHGHHQTYDDRPYIPHRYNFIPMVSHYHRHYAPSRSRSVTVPNAGGFAALSFDYVNVKVSLGYRADFFFNAIDGGIDARKNETRGFYGPYASISIGFGGSEN
jgi:hypothetical protein